MAVTDQQILDAAREAIHALITGRVASYTLPTGHSFTRLDLDKLREVEREYQARVSAAGAGMLTPVQFGDMSGP